MPPAPRQRPRHNHQESDKRVADRPILAAEGKQVPVERDKRARQVAAKAGQDRPVGKRVAAKAGQDKRAVQAAIPVVAWVVLALQTRRRARISADYPRPILQQPIVTLPERYIQTTVRRLLVQMR